MVGKRSVGLSGFEPLWERARPPRLGMLEQIRGKSLDELEDLMSGFSRDHAREDRAPGGAGVHDLADPGDDGIQADASGGRRSIFAQFA